MRATLESLWVALVNMYNTDTNKNTATDFSISTAASLEQPASRRRTNSDPARAHRSRAFASYGKVLPWMRRCGSDWFTPTSNSDAKFQIIDYRYHMTKLPTNPERPTTGQSDSLSDSDCASQVGCPSVPL
jgi:hypothetical protein